MFMLFYFADLICGLDDLLWVVTCLGGLVGVWFCLVLGLVFTFIVLYRSDDWVC